MAPANAAAIDPNRQLLPFRESLLAMLGLACVAMLVALDQTIVGTAMPRIVAELKGFDVSLLFVKRYLPNLRPARAGGPVKLDWLGGLVIAMCLAWFVPPVHVGRIDADAHANASVDQ